MSTDKFSKKILLIDVLIICLKVNGVQQIQDPIIIDLIVEQDLRGILTDAIKFMIQKTNFKGRFESTWEQFSGSE